MTSPFAADPSESTRRSGDSQGAPGGSESARRDRTDFSTLLAAWLDFRTLLRYATVGGASAGIEFAVFNALIYLGSLSFLAANLCATFVVIAFGFLSHRHFTFRNAGRYRRQLPLYGAMLAVSVLLNNALVFLFAELLGWAPPLAKLLQLGLCVGWNYSCARLLVFAPQR